MNAHAVRIEARRRSPRGERGATLFVALLAFAILGIGAFALARSVSGGLLVAGNLAYKAAATSAADVALEDALQFLKSQSPGVLAGSGGTAPSGYFATWGAADFDPVGYDWRNAQSANRGSADAADNVVAFVVHRLCRRAGPAVLLSRDAPFAADDPQQCVIADGAAPGSSKGVKPPLGQPGSPYYRVTARVVGPKRTVSYVQTMVW